MAELDPPEQAVLDKWGSEGRIYSFLRDELKRIDDELFDGKLSLPNLQIKPMWLARGLIGEHPMAGGDYEPATDGRPAWIGLFATILLDTKEKIKSVLIHEMIHHWEHTTMDEGQSWQYPTDIDETIKTGFSDEEKERRWRVSHSKRFVSRADEIAQILHIPVRGLLFG